MSSPGLRECRAQGGAADVKARLEQCAIALMLAGIFALCQPWVFAGYRYGFPVLLVGTLGFIVASHLRG
jgi:hypothetical protein